MIIKNIIFDLGGVILDIDYQKTIDAFKVLGFDDFDQHYTQAQQSGLFDELETGKMSPSVFIDSLKSYLPENVQEPEIVAAWNALLLPWDMKRIEFIKTLKSKYKLYLFSNTNAIHKAHFEQTYKTQIGEPTFDSLFEQAYYSHELGKRKPHVASFEHILQENELLSSETLFFDDSIQHIEGARAAGINAVHLKAKSILALDL